MSSSVRRMTPAISTRHASLIWCSGMAQKRLGRLDEARAHLRQAVALAEQIPDYYSGILSSGELVQCLSRQGQFSAALEAIEVGLQFRARFKFGGNCYSHLIHGQAECYLL